MTSNSDSQNTDDGDDYDSLDDPDFLVDEMDVDVDSLSFDSDIDSVLDTIDDIDDIVAVTHLTGLQNAINRLRGDGVSDSDTDLDSMDEDVESRPGTPMPFPVADDDNDDEEDADVVIDDDNAEDRADDDDDDDDNDDDEENDEAEDVEVVELSDDDTANNALIPATTSPARSPAPAVNTHTTPQKSDGKEKPLSKCSPTPKKRSSNDEEGMSCSICLDTISNSGAHRLVSLRCGHVFGRNCVERWLKTGCTYGARRCPDCNKRAKMSDIRVIYADKLQVLDTSEIEKLKVERDKALKEKNILGIELTKSKQMCQSQSDKLANLVNQMKQLDELKSKSCSCSANPYNRNSSKKSIEFLLINSVDINKAGGCRVLAYSSSGSLVVSQLSKNPLYAGFGVRKLDGFDLRPTLFIHLHKKPIRDMAFHQTEPNLLLSVSLDKCAKLVDTNTNTCVQTFNDDNMLWSCCWNPHNQHQLLTGSQNGIVTLYDNRQPSTPVSMWRTSGDTSPVVALAGVKNGALPNGGVFSCRFNAVQLIAMHASETAPESVLCDGPFVSMSYNSTSQMVVTTCRPSQRSPSVRHVVSQMSGSIDPANCLNYIHTFNRGVSARVMSRSHQMLMQNGDSCVAAYNETSHSTELLSVNSGGVMCSARSDDTVVDLCSIYGSDSSMFLASLTEKNLILHKLAQDNNQ